jgi:hypothetical protein
MPEKQKYFQAIILIVVMLSSMLFISACNETGTQNAPTPGLRTWLLVKAPDAALPTGKPVNVLSRTMDAGSKVSHVELYAVQWPSGQGELLIRSDPAPFDQTTFTASQIFTPTAPGHYVIKVIGYNKQGEKMESDYLGFDVTD